MFKPTSGRKTESLVWKYFEYDASANKSRCVVATGDGGGDNQPQCGQQLSRKYATNLRHHLRFKHKTDFDELQRLEQQRTKTKDERLTRQSTLHLQVFV